MTNETTASQPKSIGDDEQFQAMTAFMLRNEYYALVKLIDNFRAPAAQASATIQAAPEGFRLVAIEPKPKTCHGDGFNSCCSESCAWKADQAATIQEPVMVAEPAGKRPISKEWSLKAAQAEQDSGVAGIGAGAAPMVADPAGVPNQAYYGWKGCTIPPPGWYCTRAPGHEGPCAAWPCDDPSASPAATVKTVPSEAMTGAARDVLDERQRQVEREGWTPEHDDAHNDGSMAQAAACYAYPELVTVLPGLNAWPWAQAWFKVRDPRRNYVRAAALLLAEIERIDRAAPLADKTGGGE